jgi:hypothetical protein
VPSFRTTRDARSRCEDAGTEHGTDADTNHGRDAGANSRPDLCTDPHADGGGDGQSFANPRPDAGPDTGTDANACADASGI